MAYLLLSNGMAFEGKRFGAKKDCVGEVVFTTDVVGYLEALTDPAYAGQIIVQTFPLIGNYGVIFEDLGGRCCAHGYVVRELCKTPSNFRSEGSLEAYLEEQGIAGIEGIDTRELTRVLRDQGTMNGIICDTLPEDVSVLERDAVAEAVRDFKPQAVQLPENDGNGLSVGVLDLGGGASVARRLWELGCRVRIFDREVSAEELLASGLSGVVFSDGPGDPAQYDRAVKTAGELMGKTALLGVSLGHQIIALSKGAATFKMKYGHRGGQPVREVFGSRTLITAQNHGYAVDPETVSSDGTVEFVNANDGTCEGISYPKENCFTVQFSPLGRDAAFVFDKFIQMMGGDGR